jgi:hypothetical protein
MKKQVILSILFSVAATVAAFSQKTAQPNVSAAPAPKAVTKDAENTTGVERADPKTAEKPSKGNDALKAATKRKMEKNKTTNQPKGTVGTATGKNERREAAQRELKNLEAKKRAEKAGNSAPSNRPSGTIERGVSRGAQPTDGTQPKKKDN